MQTTLASDADILKEIEAFIAQYEMPLTTFGRKAAGDPRLVADLRNGRELRRSTEKRVREFMARQTEQVPA